MAFMSSILSKLLNEAPHSITLNNNHLNLSHDCIFVINTLKHWTNGQIIDFTLNFVPSHNSNDNDRNTPEKWENRKLIFVII